MQLAAVLSPGGARLRRRAFCCRGVALLATLLSLALAPSAMAETTRPPLIIPHTPNTVLERLPRSYALLQPSALPSDATPGAVAGATGAPAADPLADANRLYAAAAQTGDMRLSTRADALLARLPAAAITPQLLQAQAFGAQHRHDFDAAIALLDRAIALEPRDGGARLARAEVHIVSGRLDRARADCIALSLGVDSSSGMLCVAALSLRRGELASAAATLDRWLEQTSASDPARRFGLVMRGEIASRANAADTDQWFTEAMALSPDDVRTLAAYTRHLRRNGRFAEIVALLKTAPDTDPLHLQRALAAHALGSPDAAQLSDAQGRRYALAHAVGTTPELRDEAEYLLTLRNDPRAALALAQQNFRSQRDLEDVELMQRTARAAGDPAAMAPVRAWANSQQLRISDVTDDSPGTAQ